ncbi:MerR family transcriptional regulator [Aeromicrobium yanjiei]|uniref:MerR family transcriptional regulator n=1 Tax=Aeromicrobium yanjiei TaxID=2662028 RepID=UPI0039A00248
MTPRRPVDPDAITFSEAVDIIGLRPGTVRRWKREGLMPGCRRGRTAYSRSEALVLKANPWITGVEAAAILGVSHVRVSQLAANGKIPVHLTRSGERVYRRLQIEVVSNARRIRFPR